MTKRELIDLCLTMPNVYEDYPFDENAAVIRHKDNKKMFALIGICNKSKEGRLFVNLKCEPNEADFLRNIYTDVIPGWHMNKKHWNTVYVDGDVPFEELQRMIGHAYDLIRASQKAKRKTKSK
ncbi:MAG: MmcQ/YjbR family DNA-binding protein [Oscillospiraceae bacterium]|nr:MmcQ/YjbR family DNA-binding protein [Oscillospiraceae bacterium]